MRHTHAGTNEAANANAALLSTEHGITASQHLSTHDVHSSAEQNPRTVSAFAMSSGQTTPIHRPANMSDQDRAMIEALRTGSHADKAQAADRIAQAPTPDTVKALIRETAACTDPILRQLFLDAVRRIDGSRYARQLSEVLGSWQNGDLRTAALDALISSGSSEAVRVLKDLAEASAASERLVRELGRGLARFDSAAAVPELLRNLDSEVPAVRAGSIASLARIGNPDAVLGLYARFEQAGNSDRAMILEGFRRVTSPAALPELRRLLGETHDAELKTVLKQVILSLTLGTQPAESE